jgi:hypothetical protein
MLNAMKEINKEQSHISKGWKIYFQKLNFSKVFKNLIRENFAEFMIIH